VTEHADQLREAFETHENQTPDPAAVYARVQEMSRKYQRRRKGAVVAGGAFLGVGLIAGATQLPGIMAGSNNSRTMYAAGPASSASALPSPFVLPSFTQQDLEKYAQAYYSAGYDYDDAMRLARLWHLDENRADLIKAEAGKLLLSGQSLPFPATPDPTEPTEAPTYTDTQLASAEVFYHAGYSYADAVQLADLWKLTDVEQAKIHGGELLQHGQRLPIKPDPKNVAAAKNEVAAEAFFKKGYDYADAKQLARLWHLKTPYDAKVAAGKKILAGQPLPIKP
jgi:hypothetical protein